MTRPARAPDVPPMTVGEYLARAERRPERPRHELVSGRPVEMAAEKNRHALVEHRVCRLLEDAVEVAGLTCTAFPAGVTVVIDESTAREPDAVLQCGGEVDPDGVACEEPLLIVEVSSPSTAGVDALDKLAEYVTLPSVRHCVTVDPVKRLAVHHERRGAEEPLLTRIVREGALRFDPPGISIGLADCFASLDRFEDRADADGVD